MKDAASLSVEYVPIESLVPYDGNAKNHTEEQVRRIMRSITEFGNCDPIGVWTGDDGIDYVVEGHGRLLALSELGYDDVPVIYLNHLSDEQRRAYGLVHNQLTLNSGFDLEFLAEELAKISDIDMEDYGFGEFDEFDTAEAEPSSESSTDSAKYVICPCCGGRFELT